MVILIVDDEPDIVEGIITGVDLEGLGFSKVLAAKSGEQAMELMRQQPVDVLLTDIEMSDMDGLTLLEWVREQDFDTVTIFCTAYPEFNYAKKAVELQAFDYYLKPIRYGELTEKLRAAVRKVQENRRERQHKLYGDYWLESQPDYREDFWNRVLMRCGGGETDGGWVLCEARKRRLPYREEDAFTLLIFDLYRENKLKEWDRELLDTAFENVLAELFSLPGCTIETTASVGPGAYQMILRQERLADREQLRKACGDFIRFCNQHMGISADCYFCSDVPIRSIGSILHKAVDIYRDDITGCNQIYDIFPYKKKDGSYRIPAFSARLEQMMLAGEWRQAAHLIRVKLQDGASSGRLTRSGLVAFQQDLIQVVHAVLQAKGVPAHTLFCGEAFDRMAADAAGTVGQMMAFTDYLLGETMRAVGEPDSRPEGEAAVEKVRQYIDSHLSEPLSRGVLAGLVFMNPDYFAKVFKEKAGMSLTAYIKRRRIEWAKELLAQTALPVSQVAQQVGYDNLSYFSSVFHDQTGLSPGEYRRRRKGGAG